MTRSRIAKQPTAYQRLAILCEAADGCMSAWGADWLTRKRDELAGSIGLDAQMQVAKWADVDCAPNDRSRP